MVIFVYGNFSEFARTSSQKNIQYVEKMCE